MSSNTIKRRNIFIKQAFQGRFIVGVFLLILLSSLCSALLIYWITGGDLQAQSQSAHTNILNASERLGISIFIGNFIAFIIAGTLAIVVVLYASHKIAGPLYRFEVLCEQVGNGQLETITTLRENDQLQDLAKAFTGMVNNLRLQKSTRESTLTLLKTQIAQLATNNQLTPEQNELLRTIETTVRQLEP